MTLEFTLENFGNVNVLNLSLVDDLDTAFGAGNYSITTGPTVTTTPTTSTIVINTDTDTTGPIQLLMEVLTLKC